MTKSTEANELLTLQEFCIRTSMSVHWGRAAVAQRKIAIVRIGRAIRVPLSEVGRLIEVGLIPPRRSTLP
jgi:hypothetical protein